MDHVTKQLCLFNFYAKLFNLYANKSLKNLKGDSRIILYQTISTVYILTKLLKLILCYKNQSIQRKYLYNKCLEPNNIILDNSNIRKPYANFSKSIPKFVLFFNYISVWKYLHQKTRSYPNRRMNKIYI